MRTIALRIAGHTRNPMGQRIYAGVWSPAGLCHRALARPRHRGQGVVTNLSKTRAASQAILEISIEKIIAQIQETNWLFPIHWGATRASHRASSQRAHYGEMAAGFEDFSLCAVAYSGRWR